jgi:hypothetical protein
MTHFWIIEADSALELEKGINRELTAGGRLEGRAFLSAGQKYYQAITREVSSPQNLEILGLTNLEAFQIN